MSDSLQPLGLYSPWNSSGQHTGMGSLSLLQSIFPTQGSNPGLLHCRRVLYQLRHQIETKLNRWSVWVACKIWAWEWPAPCVTVWWGGSEWWGAPPSILPSPHFHWILEVLRDARVHTGLVKPQSFQSPWYLLLQCEVQPEFMLLMFLKHFKSDFKIWIRF